MRIQEYVRLLADKNTMVQLQPYLPFPVRGPIPIGPNFRPVQDCGCMYTHMPSMGENVPAVVVTVMCDKHELGQLLADERARLEVAWGRLKP